MFKKAHKNYIEALVELEQLEKDFETAKDRQLRTISKLFKKRQEVCPHTHTKEEDDYNRHHSEEWTILRCTMCDKQLDRY